MGNMQLYTKEQIIEFVKWISGSYTFGNITGKWYLQENTNNEYTEEELFDRFRSLKQPKKD